MNLKYHEGKWKGCLLVLSPSSPSSSALPPPLPPPLPLLSPSYSSFPPFPPPLPLPPPPPFPFLSLPFSSLLLLSLPLVLSPPLPLPNHQAFFCSALLFPLVSGMQGVPARKLCPGRDRLPLCTPGRQHHDRHQRQHRNRLYGLHKGALHEGEMQIFSPSCTLAGQNQSRAAPSQPGRGSRPGSRGRGHSHGKCTARACTTLRLPGRGWCLRVGRTAGRQGCHSRCSAA